ncbi:unnamed protein product, partial [Phaeothamnion confervicola]
IQEEWVDLLEAVGGANGQRLETPLPFSVALAPPSSAVPSPPSRQQLQPPPALPKPGSLPQSKPPAGAIIDTPQRLSQRAWLRGTRSWGPFAHAHRHGGDGGAGRFAPGAFGRMDTLGQPWTMRMCVQAATPAHAGSAVSSLCVGPGRSEAILLSGAADGTVAAWGIEGAAPACRATYRGHQSAAAGAAAVPVSGVELVCRDDFAASLSGTVHVWSGSRSACIVTMGC